MMLIYLLSTVLKFNTLKQHILLNEFLLYFYVPKLLQKLVRIAWKSSIIFHLFCHYQVQGATQWNLFSHKINFSKSHLIEANSTKLVLYSRIFRMLFVSVVVLLISAQAFSTNKLKPWGYLSILLCSAFALDRSSILLCTQSMGVLEPSWLNLSLTWLILWMREAFLEALKLHEPLLNGPKIMWTKTGRNGIAMTAISELVAE